MSRHSFSWIQGALLAALTIVVLCGVPDAVVAAEPTGSAAAVQQVMDTSGVDRGVCCVLAFGNVIAAFDADDQRLLWKHAEPTPIDSRGMALRDDKVFLYCPEKHFRCLSATTGDVVWTNADAKVRELVEQPGRVCWSTEF